MMIGTDCFWGGVGGGGGLGGDEESFGTCTP